MDYCTLYNQTYSKFTPDWLEGEKLSQSKAFINDNAEALINFFESYISQFQLEDKIKHMNVLELGCGLGGFSQYLASKVGSITAIDVSPLAIANAKEYSSHTGRHINFLVQDVAKDFDLEEKFDMIIDSHLLHCLVSNHDRKTYFNNIQKHMKSETLFLAESMVFHHDLEIPLGYSFNEENILTKEINGKDFPIRAIYDSLTIENEVKNSGFKIHYFYYHNELSFYVFDDYKDYPIKYLPKTVRLSATLDSLKDT